MSKQVKSKDVIQPKIFADPVNETEKFIVALDKLDEQAIRTAKSLKKMIDAANRGTRSGINDLINATNSMNNAQQQALIIERQRLIVQTEAQRLAAATATATQRQENLERSRTTAVERQEAAQRRANAQQETANRRAEEAARPYRQLEAQLNESRRASEDLGAQLLMLRREGREDTEQFRELSRSYESSIVQTRELSAGVVRLDRTLGNHRREVGNYENALRGLQNTGRGVTNFLGNFGLALGGAAIAQSVIKTLRNFDEGAADIAKTVGVTIERARELSKELLNIDTRTSVENLQKIAAIGGQLGIGEKDIIGFTGAVDKLNVALGDEFTGGAEEITAVVGGLRNVFSDVKSDKIDEDILKIGNAINELGASGAATGPVVSDFAGRIGGVGIPLGLTTGQVLGLSATLQELNVNAERGGTAVTKILQSMGKNTQAFAKLAGVPLKEFENLVNTDIYGAFQKVVAGTKQFQGNTVGLSKTLDKLGLDGAGASEVFLKLSGNMELLDQRTTLANKSLGDTQSITDEFNTKNNTLGATLDKLTKSWDSYVIGVDSATGATGGISSFIGLIAKNLPLVINTMVKLTAAFVAYKIAVGLVNTDFKALIRNFGQLRNSTQSASDALVNGERSAGGFGKALKGIGWTALIALAFEFGKAIFDIATGADVAEQKLKSLEKYRTSLGKKQKEFVNGISKEIEEGKKAIELQLARGEINEKQASQRKKDLLTAKVYFKEVSDFQNQTSKTVTFNIFGKISDEVDGLNSNIDRAKQNIVRLKSEGEFSNRLIIASEEARIRALKESRSALFSYNKELKDQLYAEELIIASGKNITELTKEQKKAIEDRNKALADYTRRAEDIEDARIQEEADRAKAQAKRNYDREIAAIEYTGKAAERLQKDLKLKLEDEITKIDQEARDKQLERELAYIENTAARTALDHELTLDEELKFLEEKLRITGFYGKETTEIEQQIVDKKKEIREKAYEDEITAIGRQAKEDELALLKSGATEEEFSKKSIENKRKELEAKLEATQKAGKETIDIEIELANLDRELQDKKVEEEKARQKDLADFRKKTIDGIIEQLKRESEYRDKMNDKEIANQQRLQDQLQAAANAGNISAQQSIAASQEAEKKATVAKQKEAQRQKALDDLKIFYDILELELEKAKESGKNPLVAIAKAVSESTLVKGIGKGLSGFFKGTKGRLGDEHSAQLSGRDGHIIRADGSEGILTGKKMDALERAGLRTTDDITNAALMFRKMSLGELPSSRGTIIKVQERTPDPQIEKLIQVIEEKEEFSMSEVLKDGLIDAILTKHKKGNQTKYGLHK